MLQGRHVGGDRSRNGLPESCAGYVYRGADHWKPKPDLRGRELRHPLAAARRKLRTGQMLRLSPLEARALLEGGPWMRQATTGRDGKPSWRLVRAR